MHFDIRTVETGSARSKSLEIDDDLINAIENIKSNNQIYVYLDKIDYNELALITSFILKRKQIPNLIFSLKEDRDSFFKSFYCGTFEDVPYCTYQENCKYLIADFSGASNSAWNGIYRTSFDKLAADMKTEIKPILVSKWADTLDHSSMSIFVKTIARSKEIKSLTVYNDYEDIYLSTKDKKNIIFVFDIDSLPRPEKFLEKNYNTIIFIRGKMQRLHLIGENRLGVSELRLDNSAMDFFDKLDFYHKSKFTRLFIRLVWSKLTQVSEGAKTPDELEKQYFSSDIGERNRLEYVFYAIKGSLSSYFLDNFRSLKEKLSDTEIIFNLTEEDIENLKYVGNKKLFLPADPLFRSIFSFLFAPEIIYDGLRDKSYEWLQKNFSDYIKKEINELKLNYVKVTQEKEEPEQSYNEKIILKEQFGEYRNKEIDCRKLMLIRSDGSQAFMFIPVNSTSTIRDVKRDGSTINIKFINLIPGDIFEKEYWTYNRLMTTLLNRQDLIVQDPELSKAIKISEKFRKALAEFLNTINKNSVEGLVRKELDALGFNEKQANYITMASWVDTIMSPQTDSAPIITGLIRILANKYPESGINFNTEEFMNSCQHIKSRRKILDEIGEDSEARKESYKVIGIEQSIVKVRGENVGRICTVT